MLTDKLHPLYQQLRLELPHLLHKWEQGLSFITRREGSIPDSYFVGWAALSQRTRSFMRLLDEDFAEETCVALETICTFIVSGALQDSGPLRRQAQIGVTSLCRLTRWHLATSQPLEQENREAVLANLRAATLRLQRYANTSALNEYGGYCQIFPVNAYEDDGVPLRIRGFDLVRLETEGLSLYLLEFEWSAVMERGTSLMGLLTHTAHNGHVFDVRYARHPYCNHDDKTCFGVLRLLYGTPLELDFVQAIARVPGSQLFIVDKTRIRRHEPSWGEPATDIALASPIRQKITIQDIDPLLKIYDAALSRAFASAKAPRVFEPMSPEAYQNEPSISS